MARSVTIELVVDSKGAVKSIKSVDGSLVDLNQTVETEGREFGRLMDTAYGVALANFAARAADALLQVVPQIYELGTAAEETANKFNVVFGQAAPVVDNFLESWAHMAGMTITQGREMSSTMGSILLGMGFTKDAAADMGVAIMKLAGDMQSFDNVPIEEALDAIRSGLVGEIEPLSKFGVKFLDADVKMRAATMTGKKLNSVFSQGELVAARFALMVERQQHKLGDLVNTQDSTANATRRAYAETQERAQQLAENLLPIFGALSRSATEFMADNEEAITATIEGIASALIFTAKAVGEFIGTVAEIAKVVKDNKEVAFTAAGAWLLYTAAVNASTVAQAALNWVMRRNPIALVIGVLLTAIAVQKRYGAELRDMRAGFAEWESGLIGAFQNVLAAVRDFFSGIPFIGDSIASGIDSAISALGRERVTLLKAAQEERDKAKELRDEKKRNEEANKALGDSVLNLADLQDILKNSLGASSEEMRKQIQALIDAKGAAKKHAETLDEMLAAQEKLVASDQLEEETIAIGDAIESVDDKWQRLKESLTSDALGASSIRGVNTQLANLREMLLAASSPEVREQISALIAKLEELKGSMETPGESDAVTKKLRDQEQAARAVSAALQDTATDMIGTFAAALSGAKGLGEVGDILLDQFATLASRIGQIMIGLGVGTINLGQLLSNPYALIAAGTALLVLAEAAKSGIKSEVSHAGGTYGAPASSPELQRTDLGFAGGLGGFQGSNVAVTQQSFNIGLDINLKGESVSKGTDLVHTFNATEHRSVRAGNK